MDAMSHENSLDDLDADLPIKRLISDVPLQFIQ